MIKKTRTSTKSIRGCFCFMVAVVGCFLFSGCQPGKDPKRAVQPVDAVADGAVPRIVTADIQQGIEKHIDEQVKQSDGYFRVPFEGGELELKLVRVHLEYLASLGPTRHFACVDMVTDHGEFYDVDFFMEGPRGSMKVTETTVHKKNGKPFYVWKQAADKTWGRVPIEEATNDLLGVISSPDKFFFRYETDIPEIQGQARMWLPLATSDEFQKVRVLSIAAPASHQVITESANGNQILFFTLGPEHSGKKIVIQYDVERLEKGAYPGDAQDAARHLIPTAQGETWEKIRTVSGEVVAGKEGSLMRARALYDHVIDKMAYKRCGTGWGTGDVKRICDLFAGNCTDFHSYFIALARAADIPARFAIGASIPAERDDSGIEGYHCWAEFFAEGKWWPVDISEGNKFTALSMYYFGHHPANRFEFSRGRDLVFEPGPDSGRVNFLAYPVFEINGKPVKVKTNFSFTRNILRK
ncbi:MAG: transglutaminase domain-containing protein [Candidatus Omnitrophota bacterium]